MLGKTCSAFMRSPQAQTTSTRETRAERDQQAVDPAIGHGHRSPEEIGEELLAVVGPADERGVAEEEHAEGDDPAADDRDRRFEGDRDGGRARQARLPGAGEQQRQRADRRGHERDDEDLHDRVQPLLQGLLAGGGAVGDGGGAVAGLVRVDAAGEPVANRDPHADAGDAAARRLQRERLAQDQTRAPRGCARRSSTMTISPPTR